MTSSYPNIRSSIGRRLGTWGDELARQGATPLMLAGFTPRGKMTVIFPEDVPLDQVEGMLRETLDLIEKRRIRRQ